jgi:hypothetical protein
MNARQLVLKGLFRHSQVEDSIKSLHEQKKIRRIGQRVSGRLQNEQSARVTKMKFLK